MRSRYAGAWAVAATLLFCALLATLIGSSQAVIVPDHPCPYGNNYVNVVAFTLIKDEEANRNGSTWDKVTLATESTCSTLYHLQCSFPPLCICVWCFNLIFSHYDAA